MEMQAAHGPHKIFGYRPIYSYGRWNSSSMRAACAVAWPSLRSTSAHRTGPTLDDTTPVYDIVQRGIRAGFVYGPPKAVNGVLQPTLLLPSRT